MSASNRHYRLSPVRACVALIVVYLAVCAALFAEDVKPSTPSDFRQMFPTLFADEKSPAPGELNHSFAPAGDICGRAQRIQRTQREGDDRVGAFYDGYLGFQEQQKRDAERLSRYSSSHRSRHYASSPRFSGPHAGHRLGVF